MNRHVLLMVVAASVALSGCSTLSGYPNDPIDNKADLAALSDTYKSTAITAYLDQGDEVQRTIERNKIVYGRLIAYDVEFGRFTRRLVSRTNGFNVGSDFTNLALTGLATAVTNAATKTSLTAAAIGVLGAKGAVEQEVFYQKTLPAIIVQMEANRLKIRATIETGLMQPDAKYPLSEALVDLQTYADAGNINTAVASISQSASNQAAQSSDDIQALRSLAYANTDSGKRLVAWLYPAGDETKPMDSTHEGELQRWMNADKVDPNLAGLPINQFVHGNDASLEADRVRALADKVTLNIP